MSFWTLNNEGFVKKDGWKMKLLAPVFDQRGLFPPTFEDPLCDSHFLKGVDVAENMAIGFKVLVLQKLSIFLE